MKSFECQYKSVRCEVQWLLRRPMPRGFKTLVEKYCQVADGFLRRKEGRSILKGKTGMQLCVALVVCGDTRMRTLNRQHRRKDKSTDVLSFPQYTDWGLPAGFGELLLGDIVISHNVCEKQAKAHRISYGEEFSHLFLHGTTFMRAQPRMESRW